MEKLKVKHDHKLTDIIKVGIFAIFLLLPFLTYAPTGLFYGFNEYAVNETTTEVDIQYKYQSNEVNSIDDLVEGNIYHFHIEEDSLMSYIPFDEENMLLSLNFININYYNLNNYSFSLEDVIENSHSNNGILCINFEIMYESTNINIFPTFNYDNDYLFSFSTSSLDSDDLTLDGDFIFLEANNITIGNINNLITITDYNVIESVDVKENVENTITQQMYNSWQKMWETPMYSWTNNSILKTGLDNFTGVFGVNNQSYITNLITYELIIVTIYIVIDIVLTLFKWLTHMVGSKE